MSRQRIIALSVACGLAAVSFGASRLAMAGDPWFFVASVLTGAMSFLAFIASGAGED